jgi:putative nucleotidyltransferase with HDIG domain
MNIPKINRFIEKIESVPTLPYIVTELMQIIGNPQSSAGDVSKVLARDQALTAKILKLANSAYYGFPQRISTVKHATAILGFNTVKSVALSIAVFDFFKNDKGGFNRRAFWAHSLGCAVTAHLISRHIRYSDPEKSFVAGLLHDIGKVVLDEFFHDDFLKVMEVVRYKSCSLLEAENEVLGVGHDLVGDKVTEHWNLPKVLRFAIRYHHVPPMEISSQNLHRDIAGITYLANILTTMKKIGSGGDQVIPVIDDRIWEFLGMKPEDHQWLLTEMDVEVEKARDFFSMLND